MSCRTMPHSCLTADGERQTDTRGVRYGLIYALLCSAVMCRANASELTEFSCRAGALTVDRRFCCSSRDCCRLCYSAVRLESVLLLAREREETVKDTTEGDGRMDSSNSASSDTDTVQCGVCGVD
jgi:hypothetical protein